MGTLDTSQLQSLVDGLTNSIADSDEMWYLLYYYLGRDLADITENQPNKKFAFTRVVKAADDQGWILEFLDAAQTYRPAVAEFKVVAAQLRPAVGTIVAPPSPWEISLIGGALPFIDREPLRDFIRDLEENAWPRILVVQGSESTGKSHTKHFVRYRADECRDRFVWIDLYDMQRKLKVADLRPEHVATSLCKALDLPLSLLPPKEDEQDARWAYTFCENLTAPLAGRPQRAWIFVDEFNKALLHSGTLDLFKELASRIDAQIPNARLLLLGFNDSLPLDAEQSAHRDTTTLITDTHLADFFRNVYRARGKSATDEQLAGHVAQVRVKIAANEPEPYKAISREAAAEARAIK